MSEPGFWLQMDLADGVLPAACMQTVPSFRDLLVWQKAIDLTVRVHRLVKRLPKAVRRS